MRYVLRVARRCAGFAGCGALAAVPQRGDGMFIMQLRQRYDGVLGGIHKLQRAGWYLAA